MSKRIFEPPVFDPDRRDFVTAAAVLLGLAVSPAARAENSPVDVLPAPSETKTTVLITGANRGLGLEFAKIYADKNWRVIAACRRPGEAGELNALAEKADVVVEPLDVTDHAQIDRLSARYQNIPIDVLLNNAGISGGTESQLFGRLQYEVYQQVHAVNAIGPLKMAEAFLAQVRASALKKIITVSSSQGSISSVKMPMLYWYRSSKSSVNMLMVNLAFQIKRRGVIVGLVTPGATATDFIADEFKKRIPGIREPAVAAVDMVRNIDRFTLENTGTFFNYDGEIVPW
jgi:NAD(P)-dependent dehydrogenase (short-subunit alcohol dehydrogenase family)